MHRAFGNPQQKETMKPIRYILGIILAFAFVLTPVTFTGCGSLKPVPVAEGHDAVVVNAERIQKSSLAIYKQVTEWELKNRASLPAEVSRAVDKIRAEFPNAWRLSSQALKDYKANRGPDATAISKITAGLSAVQTALLNLQGSSAGSPEILQASNAIASLVNSLKLLLNPTN